MICVFKLFLTELLLFYEATLMASFNGGE